MVCSLVCHVWCGFLVIFSLVNHSHTVNDLKFRTLLFFFSNKIVVIRAGINTVLIRIANRENPDQTDHGLCSLSRLFIVRNIRKSTECLSVPVPHSTPQL